MPEGKPDMYTNDEGPNALGSGARIVAVISAGAVKHGKWALNCYLMAREEYPRRSNPRCGEEETMGHLVI